MSAKHELRETKDGRVGGRNACSLCLILDDGYHSVGEMLFERKKRKMVAMDVLLNTLSTTCVLSVIDAQTKHPNNGM